MFQLWIVLCVILTPTHDLLYLYNQRPLFPQNADFFSIKIQCTKLPDRWYPSYAWAAFLYQYAVEIQMRFTDNLISELTSC